MDVIYRTSVLLGTVFDALGSHSHSVCSKPVRWVNSHHFTKEARDGGGVRDVKEQMMKHLVQETWSPELPASLGISLGSFPLSLPDSPFCPDSIFLSRFSINYSCLFLIFPLSSLSFPVFLSTVFSLCFSSSNSYFLFSFLSFQFSVVFFPAQQYFPRKTDLIYYQSFAALCPVFTHSSSLAADEPLITVPHNLIPISNTHMVLLMSGQVGSYPGCLSRSYPLQREELKGRIISLYPAVPQTTQMERPML